MPLTGGETLRLHHGGGEGARGVTAVAAGATHSLALTADGAVLAWASADPQLRCFPVHGLG
jgi:alpha-tubulin suppressor-like RCC1 family protein